MIVDLPVGHHDAGGRLHRDAVVVPMSGRAEELLCDGGPSPAEQTTAVLAACLHRVGSIDEVDEELARNLTVGDRTYLLLRVREATFGPDVALVARCSWPDCGERVDIAFRVPDVPVLRPAGPSRHHEIVLSAGAAPDHDVAERTVRFRLPTGADQETCAPLLETNPAAALRTLLRACVLPGPVDVDELGPRARAEIEAAMAQRAGGPALTMQAHCPGCRRDFDVPLDVADFLFGEVSASTDLLLRQVHYLAFHYHWPESEILDMPRQRRLRYVELLAEEIDRMNDAVG